jgi:hypothetical protein
MSVFTDICLVVVPSAIAWLFFFTFCATDSPVQKRRFRKAVENILEYISNHTKGGCPPTELSLIHKNKKFTIGIIKTDTNSHYSTYRIFINGDEAAVYHRLEHMWASSYYFEAVNKRHRDEVESIIYAGNKVLKSMSKPKKEKKDGYTEYSYFK